MYFPNCIPSHDLLKNKHKANEQIHLVQIWSFKSNVNYLFTTEMYPYDQQLIWTYEVYNMNDNPKNNILMS